MHKALSLLMTGVVLTVFAGCTVRSGNGAATSDGTADKPDSRMAKPTDTLYTEKAAMRVYDYDPVRALQIIDSAVIVGNLSPWQADKNRARIYSQNQLGERFDSLMHWTAGSRLDSARAVGERLLLHDSIKNSLAGQQDVLEILAYTARIQTDTITWLQRSRQLVDVCRQRGAETVALRNEAEVGAALCRMGQQTKGMAMLDSVIEKLSRTLPQPLPMREGSHYVQGNDTTRTLSTPLPYREGLGGESLGSFNELDALIIALKRKIGVITETGQPEEVLPLARRVVTLLDDYEKHPDQYHDGTYREPSAEQRDDYIRFYRSQAQNFIAIAYAALGKTGDMNATFKRLENIVREADAREHYARYRALEQQMETERQRALAERNRLYAVGSGIALIVALMVLAWYWHQKRIVSRKNRALVRQILEIESLLAQPQPQPAKEESQEKPTAELSDDALYDQLRHAIVAERLYLDPQFGRQTVIERFHLSKERVGAIFHQGSDHTTLTDFINNCRLDHARHLLTDNTLSIDEVSKQSGFATRQTFSRNFVRRFGLTPTEYRNAEGAAS